MNDRCPNAWFGSHRFEPRYDERANTSYPGGDFTGPGGSFRKLLVLNIIAASVSTGANGKTLIPKIGNYPFPASIAALASCEEWRDVPTEEE